MPMSKTTSRPINKELYQSIASIEDIPSFQLMNSNLIQPILNYDMFKNQYEYRMNKLMQRNQQIQYTIKRYQQSFKNYEYIEDNIQDKPLKQIKKIFYSQINQIYVKKIKQVINEQNYKLDETQLDEALSQKSGQYQKEINKQSESMTYNPIQNNESLQQQMITCTNCIETSREQSPEMPNKSQKIFSLRVTPQVFIETTYQQNQSQKLLQINDQEQKNQNLIQTVLKNKNSFKSLDLQKSLILSPSSLRIPKKLLTCRKFSTLNQQNLLSSPKSNLLQDFPAQTSENLEHPNDDQNLDAHKSILTNRNLQNTCFDKIALKPIAVQQIRLKKLRDKRNEKKETTFPYVKESLPRVQEPFLFQKKNNMKTQLQNQLILLTRSEQILTSLMSNGQIRGSELYQQLLLPIKLTTCQKFLSPKSNNLISRTKFKKMQQETKMFNLK